MRWDAYPHEGPSVLAAIPPLIFFWNHWLMVNLKHFDGLTWLTLTPTFYDRSMPLLVCPSTNSILVLAILYSYLYATSKSTTTGWQIVTVSYHFCHWLIAWQKSLTIYQVDSKECCSIGYVCCHAIFWFLLLSTDPLSPKKLKLFAQHSRSRSTSDRNSINAVEKVSGDGLWWQQLLSAFLAEEQTNTWFAVWTCIKSPQCAKRICRAYLRLWWTCLDPMPLPNDWRDFVIACLAQLLTFNMTLCSVKVWCTSRV